MARVKHRVTYKVGGGKKQTRNVEVIDGHEKLGDDVAQVKRILAEEHQVRPDQIAVYHPGHAPPEKPAGPTAEDIRKMSKASLIDLCAKKPELKDIDTDQNVGPLKEVIIKALGAK